MRHFEGICSLAGVEFFFAWRQQHDCRAGERDALTRAAFESVELLQPCAMQRLAMRCGLQALVSEPTLSWHATVVLPSTPIHVRDLRAMQNYETSIRL